MAAAEVSDEEEYKSEFSRLSTSFGIGVIKLNLDDPHSSEIIFPAKYREAPDRETINQLTMNSDFKEFISTVKIDITSIYTITENLPLGMYFLRENKRMSSKR